MKSSPADVGSALNLRFYFGLKTPANTPSACKSEDTTGKSSIPFDLLSDLSGHWNCLQFTFQNSCLSKSLHS